MRCGRRAYLLNYRFISSFLRKVSVAISEDLYVAFTYFFPSVLS